MCSPADLVLGSRLTAANAGPLWREVRRRLATSTGSPLIVDASGLQFLDSVGIALLFDLAHRQTAGERAVEIWGLAPKFSAMIDLHAAAWLEPIPRPPRPGILEQIGRATAGFMAQTRRMAGFIGRSSEVLAKALRGQTRGRWTEVVDITTEAAANAVPIVVVVGFLMGIIIAFEIGTLARQFGAAMFVVDGIGVAMLRELGPLMTAIVFAGRTGVTFSAEIGTRKINEEVNAITTFGLDPVEFLVLPRLFAGLLAVPLLTLLADVSGILGGALVMANLGITYTQFYNQLSDVLDPADFGLGIAKAAVYGLAISAICCERGLATGAGSVAVGISVRGAVVTSIVAIVAINAAFTLLAS